MDTSEQHDHHGGEGNIARKWMSAPAQNPVESGTEKQSKRCSEQRTAKRAQGLWCQIKHMAKREIVILRIFLEQVRQVGSGSGAMRNRQKVHSSDKPQHTENKQDDRRYPSAAPIRLARGWSGFTRQPAAHQQRRCRQSRDCVVLLSRREAKEAYDDERP